MLRLQLLSLAASAACAAVMPNMGFQSNTETTKAKVHLTSTPLGGRADVQAEVSPKGGAGFSTEDSWGDTVDKRLDELERKVALCPCSNTEGKAPAAATTTIKEAVVRSDMKPQEVADALTKLGFKSTAPAAATTVQTFAAGGGSNGSYSGGSSGTSTTVMASSPSTTWQTSSYAAPPVQTTYWVPQQMAAPVQAPLRFRGNRTCTPVLVNGQWVCQ